MDRKPQWCPKGVVLLGLGLAVAFCIAPVEEFAPPFVAIEVGGDAWACGGYMDQPDPQCLDPDTDGDGLPDKRDPCPDDPDPNCKVLVVYGDVSHLTECSDGTRVADVTECPNHGAIYGNNQNGDNADGNGGRSRGGGGGQGSQSGSQNKGVEVYFWTSG